MLASPVARPHARTALLSAERPPIGCEARGDLIFARARNQQWSTGLQALGVALLDPLVRD